MWDVKLYYNHGEQENIRGLTEGQKTVLMSALYRLGVKAQAVEYTEKGLVASREHVNIDLLKASR